MSYGHEERRTIFALASGGGKAAVAVVRISGPSTAAAIELLIGRLPEPRKATLAKIINPWGGGGVIDTGLALWFPGSSSFTGEDCGELQFHGARAVVALMLKVLGGFPDLRLARPGEFARRAFENGKMDLVAVEALGELIKSETEQQRRLAIFQTSGHLQKQVGSWRADLIDALVAIESDLDFSDEAGMPSDAGAQARAICGKLLRTLAPLAAENMPAERLREGMSVLIAGPPNVGKSTLMNAVAQRDVAIVSERAGTTRDLIEVKLDLGGFPVNLIDTAGIRDSVDPIEQEGIRRAITRGEAADLVLWLTPAGQAASQPPKEFTEKSLWRIWTKADAVEQDLESSERAETATAAGQLQISAKSGRNIDKLMDRLRERASAEMTVEGSFIVANQRQRDALVAAQRALAAALDEQIPLEVLAEELRQACFALETLIGKIEVEDILEQLFAQFCIGK